MEGGHYDNWVSKGGCGKRSKWLYRKSTQVVESPNEIEREKYKRETGGWQVYEEETSCRVAESKPGMSGWCECSQRGTLQIIK